MFLTARRHVPTDHALVRLRHARARPPVRFGWSLIGSVGVHTLIVGLLLARCAVDETADTAPQRAIHLVITQPSDARDATLREGSTTSPPDGASGLPGTPSATPADNAAPADGPLDPRTLDPGALAALTPEALDRIDLRLAAELDPRQLAALLEAARATNPLELSGLTLAERTALEDAARRHRIDAALLAAATAERPETDPPSKDMEEPEPAIATDLPGSDDPADGRSDRPDPTPGDSAPAPPEDRPEAPGNDPDDAVADVALPEPPETLPEPPDRAEPTPPPEDEDPEEEEEEEEEPEDEETDPGTPEPMPQVEPRWQSYVQADPTAPEAPDDHWSAFISSRSTVADETTRSWVLAREAGDVSVPLDGVPVEDGSPTLQQRDGDPTADAGGRAVGGPAGRCLPPREAGGRYPGGPSRCGGPRRWGGPPRRSSLAEWSDGRGDGPGDGPGRRYGGPGGRPHGPERHRASRPP